MGRAARVVSKTKVLLLGLCRYAIRLDGGDEACGFAVLRRVAANHPDKASRVAVLLRLAPMSQQTGTVHCTGRGVSAEG